MSEPGHVQVADNGINSVSKEGNGAYAVRQRSITTDDVAEKAVELDERDIRKKQVFSGRALFWLAYQSIGVIYGDIGTSPLYVYSGTFSSNPSYNDLLGALSLIIWTLTLMVSIKYVLIVLRADDEGEGGTFAIYSLLSRYANIVRRDPREEQTIKMERVKTQDLRKQNKVARSLVERSAFMKTLLKVVGVLGVSLVMSDGVLTPAQSVLGAIQGLNIVDATITTPTIVGVSCAILIVLFLIQPLGTSKIGSMFAPIVIIWLVFNLSFGVYNLVHHDHSVLKAFSPYFAGAYLVRNKTDGWRSLGGILLAFTGVEALFADLGAFSMRAIQISWLCFAYPCLLLAYTGQAAFISDNPSAYSNPFFNAVPPGMFYPSLVLAILAAIVASQTMITATFQLLAQIIKLSYFPQIRLVHTSKKFHGQIYIPWVNWLLMVGTIIVTVAYNNTTKLGEAYGVCVILVTFITTSMVSLVAVIIWRLPVVVVVLGFLVFGALDGAYLSSALTKVPDGAWFTLTLAVILSCIFVLWRFGKENQWRAEAEDRLPPSKLLVPSEDLSPVNGNEKGPSSHKLRLTQTFGGAIVSPIQGMGIFFDKSGSPNTTPAVFIHFVQKFQAAPAVVVFFHIRTLSCPTVEPEDRFTVTRCISGAQESTPSLQNFFRVTLRHGYNDEVVTSDLGMMIYERLRAFIIRGNGSPSPILPVITSSGSSTEGSDSITPSSTTPVQQQQDVVCHRLNILEGAYDDQVVYIVGKEQMRVRHDRQIKGWVRRILLGAFLWLRGNTGSKVSNMNIDVEKLVEVGFVKVV